MREFIVTYGVEICAVLVFLLFLLVVPYAFFTLRWLGRKEEQAKLEAKFAPFSIVVARKTKEGTFVFTSPILPDLRLEGSNLEDTVRYLPRLLAETLEDHTKRGKPLRTSWIEQLKD